MTGHRHAGTVIASNYLPHARVLARSLSEQHPEIALTVLVVDAGHAGLPAVGPGVRVLAPTDLGVSPRELHRRTMLFDEQGVISSLRPLLVSHLLDGGADAVLLLDADMEALAPLGDVWDLAARTGVLLSAHATEPLGGEPGAWDEEEMLRGGTFNGGLLGVGAAGRPFLTWLGERTARDCVRDPARGLLYSQTWLNLVPALFPHAILRDRGVNAMVHSLRGRDIRWVGDEAWIDQERLRLFHYAGFDPAAPDRLCRYYDDERGAVGDRPGLVRLLTGYADRLRAAGPLGPAAESRPTLPGGLEVDAVMRARYRRELLAAERGEGMEPPDPYDEAEAFVAWLRGSADGEHGVPRYLVTLRDEREDLRAAFPEVPGCDSPRYLAWARTSREVARELSG